MFAERPTPDGVQAVSSATPNGKHIRVSRLLSEAGLHVSLREAAVLHLRSADSWNAGR